jgi:hypothetical protein
VAARSLAAAAPAAVGGRVEKQQPQPSCSCGRLHSCRANNSSSSSSVHLLDSCSRRAAAGSSGAGCGCRRQQQCSLAAYNSFISCESCSTAALRLVPCQGSCLCCLACMCCTGPLSSAFSAQENAELNGLMQRMHAGSRATGLQQHACSCSCWVTVVCCVLCILLCCCCVVMRCCLLLASGAQMGHRDWRDAAGGAGARGRHPGHAGAVATAAAYANIFCSPIAHTTCATLGVSCSMSWGGRAVRMSL